MSQHITNDTVSHVSQLANIPISEDEIPGLVTAFEETLNVIANLQELDTAQTEPTHQVTGLENVLREDEVNKATMFSQEQALANAANSHDGYFVVDRIIDND